MISAFVSSHIGLQRKNHEDNFLLNGELFINQKQVAAMNELKNGVSFEATRVGQRSTLFSVADGMGGHEAGEMASLVAMQLLKQSKKEVIEASSLKEAIEKYQQFLNLLNGYVNKMGATNTVYANMGTTIITLLVYEEDAVIINLGDSKGFIFNCNNGLTKLTEDQTYGQFLLKKGFITEQQLADKKEYKGLIKYIGVESEKIDGEVSSIVEMNSVTLFLLCSDGLTDVMNFDEIEEVLFQYSESGDWQSAISNLIAEVLSRGGQDNITIMIIAYEK